MMKANKGLGYAVQYAAIATRGDFKSKFKSTLILKLHKIKPSVLQFTLAACG